MTDAEFCQRLAALGFNQSSFARRLMELGDPREFPTLLRSVGNYARGVSSVPGEMVVILNLMERDASARGPVTQLRRGRPRREEATAP